MVEKVTKVKGDYDDDSSVQVFNVGYIPERAGRWVIDLYGPIMSSEQFIPAIRVLEASDEDNPVVINLQSGGGSLSAADTFIHAMRKCKGHIHIIATGGVHSAGTLILLEADSCELSEGFHSLIHCGSLGTIGNFNEYAAQVAFDSQYMPRMLRSAYEGFLTEEEMDSMLKGQDIWLDGYQWMERAKQRQDYFQQKADEINKPKKKKRQTAKNKESSPTNIGEIVV